MESSTEVYTPNEKRRGPRAFYSPEQREAIVREYISGDVKRKDLCKKHGIHEVTLGNWITKFRKDTGATRPYRKTNAQPAHTFTIPDAPAPKTEPTPAPAVPEQTILVAVPLSKLPRVTEVLWR